ncbi:MAG TPA: cytochrome c [Terriglobia bacterium]|nr:cytochrome c [Terriglobia bacterium]
MARTLILLLLLASTALATQFAPPRDLTGQSAAGIAVPNDVSFNKDVLPILQKNCQACHRPGEAAPMSFLTYESTRPWAKAIKQAVVTRKMPPWFAEPGHGDFRNDPTLSGQEIGILAAWADKGAPEGDAKDKPKPVQWASGWQIEPDVVISIPEAHHVPAKGSGEIKSFLVPNPFQQDTWVSSIEVRPGNASVVHHVMVQVPEDTPEPSFSWGGAVACGPSLAPQQQGFGQGPGFNQNLGTTIANLLNSGNGVAPQAPAPPRPPRNFAILEAVYAPGSAPMDFTPYDSAKLIQGGGNLRIEVHYTPNGTATSDQTRVGFKLAKEPPQYRYVTLAPRSLANTRRQIPAGEPNWETRGELEFGQDAQLVWLMPHMHLRGKDMSFRLVGANGRENTLLHAAFNFNWQLGYEMKQPVRVRKGSRMVVVAHHDNSANNKYNPDPTVAVGWGDLTSQEMVLPWFGVIVNRDADPENILAVRQSGCSTPFGLLPATPTRVQGVVPTIPSGLEDIRLNDK